MGNDTVTAGFVLRGTKASAGTERESKEIRPSEVAGNSD